MHIWCLGKRVVVLWRQIERRCRVAAWGCLDGDAGIPVNFAGKNVAGVNLLEFRSLVRIRTASKSRCFLPTFASRSAIAAPLAAKKDAENNL